MWPDGKLISLIFGHLPTSITSILNEQEAVYCRCNVHVLFSELALYALDVYYMQTYSGGGGGSGYNRIDHDENKYQEINQTLHFLQMLNRSK